MAPFPLRVGVGALAALVGVGYKPARWLSHYLLGKGEPLTLRIPLGYVEREFQSQVGSPTGDSQVVMLCFGGTFQYVVGGATLHRTMEGWAGIDAYDWHVGKYVTFFIHGRPLIKVPDTLWIWLGGRTFSTVIVEDRPSFGWVGVLAVLRGLYRRFRDKNGVYHSYQNEVSVW